MTAEQDILHFLEEGEEVEALVVGRVGPTIPWPLPETQEIVLSWEEALPYLQDWTCQAGYGQKAHAIFVWTNRRVLFIEVLGEGYPSVLAAVPRHPCACQPQFFGG